MICILIGILCCCAFCGEGNVRILVKVVHLHYFNAHIRLKTVSLSSKTSIRFRVNALVFLFYLSKKSTTSEMVRHPSNAYKRHFRISTLKYYQEYGSLQALSGCYEP